MLLCDDLYDPNDFDFSSEGDTRAFRTNRRSERECAYYRDEMARRSRHCRALGVGREYDLLVASTRRRPPALPAPTVPEDRRLPPGDHRLQQSSEGETT
ncbi:MAG: hypothetical protein V5A84_04315 [Planctomycetota bacterium]